jgi:hypothetical protein
MLRKKPEGSQLELFKKEWAESDHEGKMRLVDKLETTYGTAKHWATDKEKITYAPIGCCASNNKPLNLNVSKEQQTVAVIGDTHNPYQDEHALDITCNFLYDIQPDVLVMNGDMNDFYQASVFSKDAKRIGQMQEDVNSTKQLLTRLDEDLPNTHKIWIDGTHEHRWQKFLQDKAPAASTLDCLTVQSLFELDKFGIDHIDYEQGLLINGVFLILHGDIASKNSGETAKNQYLKNGGNGMCNHTHRGGSFFKRDRFGVWGWWENFCECRLDPDWIQNPNWVQGFSLVHFTGGKRFFVEQIPIIDGEFMYGGSLHC